MDVCWLNGLRKGNKMTQRSSNQQCASWEKQCRGKKKKVEYGTIVMQMNITNNTERLHYIIAISLKKVSQLSALICTCREQQGQRISVSQLVTCGYPICWITARTCSLPACLLLLYPNWSQVHYPSPNGMTSLLLPDVQHPSAHRFLTTFLGKCLVLIYKSQNKEKQSPLCSMKSTF